MTDHSIWDQIAREYWRKYESDEEHAERVETAQADVSWFFNRATARQRSIYNGAIELLAGDWSPRANRARDAAKGVWYATTSLARAIAEQTFEEILRDGEMSEATGLLWEALRQHEEMEAA